MSGLGNHNLSPKAWTFPFSEAWKLPSAGICNAGPYIMESALLMPAAGLGDILNQ